MEVINGESRMAMAMAVTSVIVAVAAAVFVQAWKVLWWTPHRIQRALNVQGVGGPPYRFLFGNTAEIQAMAKQARASPMPPRLLSHDFLPRLLPEYYEWSQRYGKVFLYWFMYKPLLVVTNPEDMKEILSNKFGHFQKTKTRPEYVSVFGKRSLVVLEGEKWVEHRRLLNAAFYLGKLKAMVPVIADRTAVMLAKWRQLISQGNGMEEVDALEEFKALTADIISHTAFGSSYEKGMQVFQMQHELETIFFKVAARFYIPGTRYLPTSLNRRRWKLEKQIWQCLSTLINSRLLESISEIGGGETPFGNDLLGLMMAASGNTNERQGGRLSMSMGMDEIIDECKTFFVAGHETTASLLTWTIMLMCLHPEWQERARDEVIAHCGREAPPNAESLSHLKIVSMVLNESLRLYSPAAFMFREVPSSLSSGIKVGNVRVPPGTMLKIMIASMHRDPLFWGEDAGEFNPNRFAEGIAKACKDPLAFMPFSTGPRVCIGQNFSLLEAKTVLAMLLQQHSFSFRLSPSYVHAPIFLFTLQPQHGMPIILESISSATPRDSINY